MSNKKVKIFFSKYSSFVILGLLIVLMTALRPTTFLTIGNLSNLLKQMTMVGLIAMGVSLCIITCGIDLSGGAVCAFSACVCGNLVIADADGKPAYPVLVAILITLALCFLIGLTNGIIVGYAKVPAFIATLGTQLVVKGISQLYTRGFPVTDFAESFNNIGNGYVFGIPIAVLILVIVMVLMYILMHKTTLGYHIYAVGGNESAAIVSGINSKRTVASVYIIASILAGLAGIILAARTNAALISYGQTYDMDAITCAVIGGISMAGGRGKMIGIVVGIMIVGVITNGMTILQIDAYWQTLIKGLVILGAVLLDGWLNRK